jgi:hypothetical protein
MWHILVALFTFHLVCTVLLLIRNSVKWLGENKNCLSFFIIYVGTVPSVLYSFVLTLYSVLPVAELITCSFRCSVYKSV